MFITEKALELKISTKIILGGLKDFENLNFVVTY